MIGLQSDGGARPREKNGAGAESGSDARETNGLGIDDRCAPASPATGMGVRGDRRKGSGRARRRARLLRQPGRGAPRARPGLR
ncbi:hypothetical protein, partial [Achromobacter xylosoxidans]